jgi:hypothetical protein
MHNSRPLPYSPRATAARALLAYKYCSQHQQQRGFLGGERAVLKERGGRMLERKRRRRGGFLDERRLF